MSEYVVIYHRWSDGTWGAYVPDLPEVLAVGDTRDECAAAARQALGDYAGDVWGRGGQLPRPAQFASTLRAPDMGAVADYEPAARAAS